ncbi:MAG: hypothetical protein HY567_04090 [Candidatus Kerfeldbacteria bacterium]|nr:hypothetical protein [Candidatus Kerfeldbacteria bacterium]
MAGVNAHDSVAVRAARFVIRDVVFDVIRFPVWWYTTGTRQAARFVGNEFLSVLNRLSLRILFRNLLKPMYGDYSRSGRIISLFMRLIVFAFNTIALFIWTVVLVVALIVWLAVLPLAVYQVIVRIIG